MDALAAPAFTHTMKTVGEQLLIEATCMICGESKAVPFLDRSIEDWEPIHSRAHRIISRESNGAARIQKVNSAS